jgi:hypothetical protein
MVGCGGCVVGFPGQSRFFRRVARYSKVPRSASTGCGIPWKDGVALGCYSLTDFPGSGRQEHSDEPANFPDWRIVGDQDPIEPY